MPKRTGKNRKKRQSQRRAWPWILLGTPLILWAAIVGLIKVTSSPFIYDEASDVPSAPVGIVFGAGVLRNGQPSFVLKARLDGAIELYREHKVSRLLMSGDNRTSHYNEPKAMRTYAIRHGVSPERIEMDFAGRDTYDTCYRAKKVFGVKKAVLITQLYHAPRAVYLGRSFGIDSVAYGVKNLDNFPSAQLSFDMRELCADVKAVWDVSISHRPPYVGQEKRSLVAQAE